MKLLFCKNCQDVVKLLPEPRKCKCGKCEGIVKHEEGLDKAYYSGEEAVPLGFANSSLRTAIINQPNFGNGKEFTAFVIPKDCYTFKKIKPSENLV